MRGLDALLRTLTKLSAVLDLTDRIRARGAPSWAVPVAAVACAGGMFWSAARYNLVQQMSPTIYRVELPRGGDQVELGTQADGAAGASVSLGGAADEPAFRSGTDDMLKEDDFESYSSSANMLASGAWIFNDATARGGSITLESSSPAEGSQNLSLNFPESTGADITVDIVNRGWTDSDDLVVSLSFRPSNGFLWSTVDTKWMTVENSGSKHIDVSVFASPNFACPSITSTAAADRWRWRFYPDGGSSEPTVGNYPDCAGSGNAIYVQNNATSTKDPDSLNDGQWHTWTMRIIPETTTDAGDGAVWTWVDGVLVMEIDGRAGGNFPGDVFTRAALLDGITIGANPMNEGSQQVQTLELDDIQIWNRN